MALVVQRWLLSAVSVVVKELGWISACALWTILNLSCDRGGETAVKPADEHNESSAQVKPKVPDPPVVEEENQTKKSTGEQSPQVTASAEQVLPPVPKEKDWPVAQRWLHAMAKGNAAKLSALCSIPFRVTSAGKPHPCDSVAKDTEGAAKLSKCLIEKEALLVNSAKLATLDAWERVTLPCSETSRPLRRLLGRVKHWQCLLIQGDGVSYDVALRIRRDRSGETISDVSYLLEFSGPG
ncbi:MAG: hypothetical protein MJD61_20550 [Proteobacteria bacterium]|nr:hypothetical protein [Pseudomonadota bacterium]